MRGPGPGLKTIKTSVPLARAGPQPGQSCSLFSRVVAALELNEHATAQLTRCYRGTVGRGMVGMARPHANRNINPSTA